MERHLIPLKESQSYLCNLKVYHGQITRRSCVKNNIPVVKNIIKCTIAFPH